MLEAAPNKYIVVCALHLNQYIWMGDLDSILYYAWAINHNKKQNKISGHLQIFWTHFFVLPKTAVFTLLVHMTGQLQSS